jgi:hypothetical protein
MPRRHNPRRSGEREQTREAPKEASGVGLQRGSMLTSSKRIALRRGGKSGGKRQVMRTNRIRRAFRISLTSCEPVSVNIRISLRPVEMEIEKRRAETGATFIVPPAINPAASVAATLSREVNTQSHKTASPPATPTSHPKGTPRTGLCQQSNRSAVHRYGNWKMTLRDRRPKPAPQGPKWQKLPDRDWGMPT